MGPLDLKQLMKVLYSIDKSLGRIAKVLEALEEQNESKEGEKDGSNDLR